MRSEFSSHVAEIIPQPVEIPFQLPNGRAFTYTPDFLVFHRLGDKHFEDYPKPKLVEVKPRGEWKRHYREWFPKWKAARRYAIEQGWTFSIQDDTRIRDSSLENIRFLRRYKRSEFPSEDNSRILDTIREMGSASIDYLLTRHFSPSDRAIGITHLWHLLAARKIDCDIHRTLNDATEVWINEYV